MNNLKKGESSIPFIEQVDWKAVEYLQKRVSSEKNDFKTQVLDLAIDKTLCIPQRVAIEEQLAKDIYRDAIREISNSVKPNSRKGAAAEEYQYILEKVDVETHSYHEVSQERYSKIIQSAFSTLSYRERLAIFLKASGNSTNQLEVKNKLGVSIRQFRNILNEAQNKLQKFPQFREAFFLAFLETDLSEFDELMLLFISE